MADPGRAAKRSGAAGPPTSAGTEPVWVSELDLLAPPVRLAAPAPPTASGADRYERAHILLRVGSEPLAMVACDLTDGELDVEATIADAARVDGPRIAELEARRLRDDRSVGFETPAVSVVIGTYHRPEKVATCVAALLKQVYPAPFEVIVVENGRSDDSTERIIADRFGAEPAVRYLSTTQRGLSLARNLGLEAARHSITAFLSDDILVDSHWMLAVARGFGRHDGVECVVGYCPQLHLDTEEQQTFEHMMRWSSQNGFEPFLACETGRDDPLHPYRIAASNGSNMSFGTAYFREAGGFDPALGPGTLARGGEDLDAPVRALLAGHDVAFEPAALGWHADEQAGKSFLGTMYTYGLGLTAFLTAHLLDRRCRGPLLRRLFRGARYVLPEWAGAGTPTQLVGTRVRRRYCAANLAGRIAGPVALLRARRHARRST